MHPTSVQFPKRSYYICIYRRILHLFLPFPNNFLPFALIPVLLPFPSYSAHLPHFKFSSYLPSNIFLFLPSNFTYPFRFQAFIFQYHCLSFLHHQLRIPYFTIFPESLRSFKIHLLISSLTFHPNTSSAIFPLPPRTSQFLYTYHHCQGAVKLHTL